MNIKSVGFRCIKAVGSYIKNVGDNIKSVGAHTLEHAPALGLPTCKICIYKNEEKME